MNRVSLVELFAGNKSVARQFLNTQNRASDRHAQLGLLRQVTWVDWKCTWMRRAFEHLARGGFWKDRHESKKVMRRATHTSLRSFACLFSSQRRVSVLEIRDGLISYQLARSGRL
jgi:hypothetical protein